MTTCGSYFYIFHANITRAYLNIPVTVAVGYLEQLRVSIPWNSLSTSPTEVHIDGLYMLIVPKNEMSQDLSEHYAEKSKRVQQKLENFRRVASENAIFDNKEWAFVERMRLQVMRNMILTIRNIHVCYEMKSPTKLGHPFSFGITLHYIHLTVDDLKLKIATNNYIPNDDEMKYVLRPLNLITEIWITLKPKQHHYERSTLIFNIQIPKMNFHVDAEQISDILDFVKFQNYTKSYDRRHTKTTTTANIPNGADFLFDDPTINQLIDCFEANNDVIWPPMPKGFSMLRINFGNMMLKSRLENSDDDIDRSLFKEQSEEQEFYAKYKLELSDLRIMYTRSRKNRLHILRRTPLIDVNFYKCIFSNDANLTSWRIGAKVVMSDIQLSKTILAKLMYHLKSIPLIYSNMSFMIKRINFYCNQLFSSFY
ncbi:unnamed protein product [Rotaria sp. Silwood1]|nr:unnamed protein product [Rotaria sp. Silwood1]CAF4706029.1 unnamed protein product [Rotaria sp. Silwood1]